MDDQKPAAVTGEAQTFKPGETITPSAATAASTPNPQPTPELPSPEPNMVPHPQSQSIVKTVEATPSSEETIPQPVTPTPPVFAADQLQPSESDNDGIITWTASEFIAHDKSSSWYALLALAAVVVAALVYLLTRDKISTTVVLVAAIALGIYGARKPQQQQYQLDQQGITIGPKFYSFNEFRSFAILDEGAFSSISFMPLARFGQLVTIYFDPRDEAAIIDILSRALPLEQRGHDMVDRFMKRIRF